MSSIETARSLFGLETPAQMHAWMVTLNTRVRKRGAMVNDAALIKHPALVAALKSDLAPTAGAPRGQAATAWICRGLWVANCPNRPSCGGTVAVTYGHPMLCPYCCNVDIEGWWRPIIWPPPDERGHIEELLSRRPFPETRNWMPGETLERLRAENRAHGVAA